MENEEGRATLPKEGAGRRRVGGRLNTGTEKKVQREEKERAREVRRKEFAREGGGLSLSATDSRVYTDIRWREMGDGGGLYALSERS